MTREKPRRFARNSTSIEYAVPAIAPEPSGIRSASSRAVSRRWASRRNAAACASQRCADENRLRAAHVRVRRHDGVLRALGLIGEGTDEIGDRGRGARNPAHQVASCVDRDLLVARSPGVQPAPGVADALDQLALDERVHVLVGGVREARRIGDHGRAHVIEPAHDRGNVGGLEHAGLAERLGPGLAARDVVLDEPAIDRERLAVVEDVLVRLSGEPAGPQRRGRRALGHDQAPAGELPTRAWSSSRS